MKKLVLSLGLLAALMATPVFASEDCTKQLSQLDLDAKAMAAASLKVGHGIATVEATGANPDSEDQTTFNAAQVSLAIERAKLVDATRAYEVARAKLYICIVPLPPAPRR